MLLQFITRTARTPTPAIRPADQRALRPILALPGVKAGLDTFGVTWIEIDDAGAGPSATASSWKIESPIVAAPLDAGSDDGD